MLKNTVLIVLLALALNACQKEYTGDPLLKFRLKEYTHDHYKYSYAYDALNRVMKSVTFYDDRLVYTTQYFYVNNRLDSAVTSNAAYTTSYETYRYLGDTIFKTSWLVTEPNAKRVTRLVVSGNRIVMNLHPPCSSGDSSYLCMYEVLHWDQNNLTYRYYYSNSGSSFPLYKRSSFHPDFPMSNAVYSVYDHKANPFRDINRLIDPAAYESSENNLLRMAASDMQGDTLFRTFEHTYNAYGLPVATTETKRYNKPELDQQIPITTPVSFYTYTYEEY